MAWRLRHHLYWCECAGRIVFLDLEADRYFALPPAAGKAFFRLAESGGSGAEAEHLRLLVERGLLVEGRQPTRLPLPVRIPHPAGDYMERPCPRASAGDLLRALAGEAWWSSMLGLRRFAAVVEAAGRSRGSSGAAGPDDLKVRRIVLGSAAAALVSGAADRCLVRALAVHSACHRRCIPSRLVFGVRLHPFRAHCWVQLDDRVLVGDFEQVRLFTPIAAFG